MSDITKRHKYVTHRVIGDTTWIVQGDETMKYILTHDTAGWPVIIRCDSVKHAEEELAHLTKYGHPNKRR
jgi:hypothetical protein